MGWIYIKISYKKSYKLNGTEVWKVIYNDLGMLNGQDFNGMQIKITHSRKQRASKKDHAGCLQVLPDEDSCPVYVPGTIWVVSNFG